MKRVCRETRTSLLVSEQAIRLGVGVSDLLAGLDGSRRLPRAYSARVSDFSAS